jgi:hypothetical protein
MSWSLRWFAPVQARPQAAQRLAWRLALAAVPVPASLPVVWAQIPAPAVAPTPVRLQVASVAQLRRPLASRATALVMVLLALAA